MIDPQLITHLHIRWKQIFHSIKKLSRPILSDLGLTKVDMNILLLLKDNHTKTKAELALLLSFEPNSLTRSIDRLVNNDFITRVIDKNDRRYIQLSITNKGKQTIQQYLQKMQLVWQSALLGLESDEITLFNTTLDKVFTNLHCMEIS